MKHRGPRPAILWTLALFGTTACGVSQPKYVDHQTEVPLTACQQTALTLFETEIQPVIKVNCATAGCHLTQAVAGQALSYSDAAANRKQFLAYTGTTSTLLFNKISQKDVTHGGGDKSTQLPQATLDTWLAKEAECSG